jgi:hypothetical protein
MGTNRMNMTEGIAYDAIVVLLTILACSVAIAFTIMVIKRGDK